MKNLKLFYSTVEDENMNKNPNYYKEGMTEEQIKQDFYVRRLILGRKNGFEGNRILIPSQKKFPDISNKPEEKQRELLEKYYSKYHNGKYIKIEKDMLVGESDLYNIDLQADILMIDKDLPGIALAYPVADCPVVVAEDTKQQVAAMAHCGGEYIDRELPAQIIDALREKVDSKVENIRVFVGPHAQEKSYTYDCIPKWMRHEENWNNCLREDKEGMLHISLSRAIIMQLAKRKITLKNIEISKLDTITDPRFYSHHREDQDKAKAGRFYEGCVYLEESVKTR